MSKTRTALLIGAALVPLGLVLFFPIGLAAFIARRNYEDRRVIVDSLAAADPAMAVYATVTFEHRQISLRFENLPALERKRVKNLLVRIKAEKGVEADIWIYFEADNGHWPDTPDYRL